MSVRRRSGSMKTRAVKSIENAVNHVVEELEARRLLTTAIGGSFGHFDSSGHFISDNNNTFEYRQRSGDVVRIALSGDIDVEFIGLQLGKGSDQNGFIDTTKKLVDLTPAFVGQTPEQTTDLFEIYIAASAPDATISIATVPDLTTPIRPMDPFGGTSGPIRINDAFTGISETVDSGGGTGGVYIGARTLDTIPGTSLEQDIPILNVKRLTAFGLRPAPFKGRLGAGIFTAPGVNTGKILIGGTVTGNVNIAGSIDTFYAGAILTGDATGLRVDSAPDINDNFLIGGDIRALYTTGGIGTVGNNGPNVSEPKYNTGFDMEVGGKVGEIFSATADIYGGIHVRNDTKGWSNIQREVEFKELPFSPSDPRSTYFETLGEIGGRAYNNAFDNDSFQSAQYLYTFDSKTLGQNNIAVVDGQLDTATNVNDDDDYYAVSLLAGQTVNAQLFKRDEATGKVIGPSSTMRLGVFDPDGRLIASDYSFVTQTTNTGDKDPAQGMPLQFTADRPGVYRFAIATNGDTTFTAHTGTNVLGQPYELQIKNAGSLALGGVVADGNIYTAQTRIIINPNTGAHTFAAAALHAIDVDNGDLGSIVAGVHTFLGGDTPARIDASGSIIATGSTGRVLGYTDVPYSILNGNIRSIEGDDLGYGPETIGLPYDANANEGPNLYVHNGSVGLIRTWDAGGTAFLNDSFIDPVSKIGKPAKAVGGDYQLIDIAGTFSGTVIADRAIGVIRANAIGDGKSYIVNADNKGNDGVIDLIDAKTDIGSNAGGGPAIITGPRGNVRYMHAGGDAFRDIAFGGGTPETTTYDFGEVAQLRDDSGALVKITPTPNNVDFASIAAGEPPTLIDPGRLLVETYPIRGDLTGGSSAGSVLVKVEVEAGAGGAQRGVNLQSSGGGSVELGTLQVDSNGFGSTFDDTTQTFTLANGVTVGPNGLITGGTGTGTGTGTTTNTNSDLVDVNLTGPAPISVFDLSGPSDGLVTLDNLNNSTNGEIVNTNLGSVGTIKVKTLGLAQSDTGTEVSGVENSGGADTSTYPFVQQRNFAQLGGGVALIQTREGMGNIVAGGSIGTLEANSDEKNVAHNFEGLNAPITATGQIVNTNIGEGLPGTGTGSFARAGLFATGDIGSVSNQGRGSDIRGVILSTGKINSIRLGDGGSIIGGQILNDINYSDARVFNGGLHGVSVQSNFNNPDLQLGSIKLTGNGGIIGARVFTAFGGPISVGPGGFGILNTDFLTGGDGRYESITADGYGIRNSTINGGATVGTISATGHGQQLDANKFTPSVRGSAFGQFDTLSGYTFGFMNDIYSTLAITPGKTKRGTITKAGIISDTTITASRTLDSISAWGIQDRVVPTVADPNNSKLRLLVTNADATYPMRIAFGDEIGSVRVTNQILGLAMSAGTISTISVGDDVFEARISGASNIGTVSIRGSLRGNSTLFANGINGSLTSLSVKKSLLGDVSAVKIGTVSVGRDLGSSNFKSSTNITTLNVGNDILSGANVVANKQIGTLNIGDDLNAGAVVKAKSLGAFTIGGDQAGSLQIG